MDDEQKCVRCGAPLEGVHHSAALGGHDTHQECIVALQHRIAELEGDADVVELQLRLAWKRIHDLQAQLKEKDARAKRI